MNDNDIFYVKNKEFLSREERRVTQNFMSIPGNTRLKSIV